MLMLLLTITFLAHFFISAFILHIYFLLCLHTYLFSIIHGLFISFILSEVLRIRGNLLSLRMFIFRKTLACI